jgi:hypothetical protein
LQGQRREIGRASKQTAESKIVLSADKSSGISRTHATLTVTADGCSLILTGKSDNELRVVRERAEPKRLFHGSSVQLQDGDVVQLDGFREHPRFVFAIEQVRGNKAEETNYILPDAREEDSTQDAKGDVKAEGAKVEIVPEEDAKKADAKSEDVEEEGVKEGRSSTVECSSSTIACAAVQSTEAEEMELMALESKLSRKEKEVEDWKKRAKEMKDAANEKMEAMEAAQARVAELEAQLEAQLAESAENESGGANLSHTVPFKVVQVELEDEKALELEGEQEAEKSEEEAEESEEEAEESLSQSWGALNGTWESSVNGTVQSLRINGYTVTFDDEAQSRKTLSIDREGTIKLPSRQGGWWIAVENAKVQVLEQLHFSRAVVGSSSSSASPLGIIVWNKRGCQPRPRSASPPSFEVQRIAGVGVVKVYGSKEDASQAFWEGVDCCQVEQEARWQYCGREAMMEAREKEREKERETERE